MSPEERRAFLKEAREKLVPINRQFGKDLAEVLDEDQGKAVREKWGELSVMPPMISRLVEAEKKAREDAAKAKGDKAAKDKAAKDKDAKGDEAEGDDDGDRPAVRGKRPQPRQEGRRGGRGGQDDGDD